jgi:hypothetical protein
MDSAGTISTIGNSSGIGSGVSVLKMNSSSTSVLFTYPLACVMSRCPAWKRVPESTAPYHTQLRRTSQRLLSR